MKLFKLQNAFLCVLSILGTTSCLSPEKLAQSSAAVPFATDGHLKMLYDIRMHPSAIENNGKIYITWRGESGLPQAKSYDLTTRKFSSQVSIFDGLEEEIDFDAYVNDQHFNPSIWRDNNGYFHIIAGCHGLKSFEISGCDIVKSRLPNDIASGWEPWSESLTSSINYPKLMVAYDKQTLIYHRYGGHLGAWTYHLSPNGETDWAGPDQYVVDMSAGSDPAKSCLDFYAGSYHNARLSPDGRTLHIAYVWQQEVGSADVWPPELKDNDCAAPVNHRYKGHKIPQGKTRYNLYYVAVDLPSGVATNYNGKELATPITRSSADSFAKILDTDDRLFSVPPSIHIDRDGTPQFLGVISSETPHQGWFTHLRYVDGEWEENKITRTSNVWNSGQLDRNSNGHLRAMLMAGDGEVAANSPKGTDLNGFGWGDRIEEWISRDEGKSWEISRDITPQKGMRYQNLRTISAEDGGNLDNLFLFYGWTADAKPGEAVAFLWDDRD